jgi:hypothetical protein
MLVYAALANVDYPHSPSTPARTLTSTSSSRKPKKGADAVVAAAAAFEAPPLQPLELPRVLLPGLQQAGSGAASWKPLAGLSVGICREWYTMCDTGVLACVDSAAESLFRLGATLVDVQIPELDLLQVRAVSLLSLNFGMACICPRVWPCRSMHIHVPNMRHVCSVCLHFLPVQVVGQLAVIAADALRFTPKSSQGLGPYTSLVLL